MAPRRGVRLLGSFALLVLLALGASPSAQATAEVRLRDFDLVTLDRLDHWVNTTLTGADARLVRQDADEDGDREVSDAEADVYARRLRASQQNGTTPLAWRDDAAPLTQNALEPRLGGLVGPADSDAELRVDLGYRLTFPTAGPGIWHQLERDARQEKPGPIRVRVPAPFVHLQALGIADPRPSDDGRTLDGRTGNGTAFDVQFIHQDEVGAARASLSSESHEEGAERTPAPAPPVAIVAGVVALALRRRAAQP